MTALIELASGLQHDVYLLGLLLLVLVVTVRLVVGNIQQAAGVEDAVSTAYRDILVASVGMLSVGVIIAVIKAILFARVEFVFKVLK